MAAKRRSTKSLSPGTFRPAIPNDTAGVLRVFAVAGRIVAEDPDGVANVSRTLSAMVQQLVPPEKNAAEDCARLWGSFLRMVQSNRPNLVIAGAQALLRDLDGLGQTFDLPPLPAWNALPTGIEERGGITAGDEETDVGLSLNGLLSELKKISKPDRPVATPKLLTLLKDLSGPSLDELLDLAIKDEAIQRGEAILLTRVVKRGGKAPKGKEAATFAEVVNSMAQWIISLDPKS